LVRDADNSYLTADAVGRADDDSSVIKKYSLTWMQ
jgi:hypothetical protein